MEALSSSWGGEGGLGPVPKPLEIHEAAGTVIMETSSGRRLDDLLREARWGHPTARADAEKALEATGEWLRRFQDVMGETVRGTGSVDQWRSDMAKSLCGAESLLPPKILSQAGDALLRLPSQPWCGRVQVTGHHGDFWPGNVLVTSDGIQVVDFEGFRPGVALEDPAYFLLHSEASFDLPHSRRRFPPLSAAFWRGYGRGDLSNTYEYQFSRISVCLRLLAGLAADHSRASGSPDRRRVRRIQRALREALTWTPA
jgi:Ser/Thr protein kinase RdoA (MazF antagonist)